MDWKKDLQGNLIVDQITGFHIAPAMDIAVVAKIEVQRQTDQGEIIADSVQLAMSPQIALALASDLSKVANHILEQKPPAQTN